MYFKGINSIIKREIYGKVSDNRYNITSLFTTS